MNNKSKNLFYIFSIIFTIAIVESSYLNYTKSMNKIALEKKIAFVKLSTLPDLALSSQNSYIRHRSLSDMFSIYQNDGSLREYSSSTFCISYAHIGKK